MDFLPIFLNVRMQPCIVIGGGDVATRKVELLLKAQAKVTVVAPTLCPALSSLHMTGKLVYVAGSFHSGQIGGRF